MTHIEMRQMGVQAILRVFAHRLDYVFLGIVELHGGSLWVESEGEGRGSTFFVELPMYPKVDAGFHSPAQSLPPILLTFLLLLPTAELLNSVTAPRV